MTLKRQVYTDHIGSVGNRVAQQVDRPLVNLILSQVWRGVENTIGSRRLAVAIRVQLMDDYQ